MSASAAGVTVGDSRPAGTPVLAGSGSLFLSARRQLTGEYASFTSIAYPQASGTSVAVLERGYARGSSSSGGGTTAGTPSLAAHSYLMTIRAAAPVTGVLRVSWNAQARNGARISGAADIGDDGSTEWSSGTPGAPTWFALRLPAGITPVKLTVDGAASGTGNPADYVDYFADLFVGFTIDRVSACTFATYGTGCGPAIAGSLTTANGRHALTISLTGGFPNASALALVGQNPLSLGLGNGCSLLTDVTFATVISTDATGDGSETHSIPSTDGGTLLFQFLPLDVAGGNLVLRATDGLRLDCVR